MQEYKLARMIRFLSRDLNKKRDEQLKKMSLTGSQVDAILFFGDNENETITGFKNYVQISHQGASGIVDRLAAKGILAFKEMKKDGRAKNVYLTDKGKEIFEYMNHDRTMVNKQITKGFSEKEIKEFESFVIRALNNVRKEEEE